MPIPKAELHIHIEGTLEPELAFVLAERNKVSLPYSSVDELRAAYRFDALQPFLDLYYRLTTVLRTERDFTELADAYLARAQADGVRRAEIFFDPQAHTVRGVPLATVMNGLTASLSRSVERFGVSTALILCFLRDRPAEEALATLEDAKPYLDRIIAVGLDSAEAGHPPARFAAVFERARRLGLRAVAHAGEEGPAEYVAQALDLLGVERIDHGHRALEDPGLVARLVRERVPLTVCPFSNVRLRVVDALDRHPLARMLELGLVATVNSDDPAYFGGYIEDNFAGVARALELTEDQIRTLARNSFEAAFLDESSRDRFLGEVDAYDF